MDDSDIRNAASGEPQKRSERDIREKQAERAAEQGDHDAFGEKLANDAHARGSERGANRDFFRARSGAREQEVRNVGASNEQDEANRAEENDQRRANVLNHLILQVNHVSADGGVGFGILLREARCNRFHFGAGLFERNALLQARRGNDSGMPIAIVGKRVGPRLKGNVNIGCLKKLKARRQNTDEGVGLRVESDRLAEPIRGTAEAALPERIADHRDRRAAGAVLFGKKGAADDGRDAEKRKKAGGDVSAFEAFGLAEAGEGEIGEAGGFHGLEGMALVAPVFVILIGGGDRREHGVAFDDEHDARGVAKCERAKQHAIDDGKDRGIRADAESEREHRDGR